MRSRTVEQAVFSAAFACPCTDPLPGAGFRWRPGRRRRPDR